MGFRVLKTVLALAGLVLAVVAASAILRLEFDALGVVRALLRLADGLLAG